MLHHAAYVTHDVEATVDFYTNVLGLPLVSSVTDDRIPSTGDPFPYIHLFFKMGDGSTIAFFEALDLPEPATATHPAYNIFNHIAWDVGSSDVVDQWADYLRARGIDVVGPTDHGIIYSVYFYDPNGIRLEFTADVNSDWRERGEEAESDVSEWKALRAVIKSSGSSEEAAEWIRRNRAKHKL